MQRKKKPKKVKTLKTSPLTPEEEALVASLLQQIRDINPREIVSKIPEPRLARVLVERLPLDDAPPISLLSAIKEEFEDKEVQKALKRTLFKLKRKGFSDEEFDRPQDRSPGILKAPLREKPAARIGPLLDLYGTRAVMITCQRSMQGRDMGMGLVSEEKGFQHFALATVSKKRLQEMEESLTQGAGPMVNTSLSHGAMILEKAYKRHMELHPSAPEHYLDFRPWLLENTVPRTTPVIYDFIAQEAVPEEPITDSRLQKLFDHPLMQTWIVDFEQLRPYLEEIQEANGSAIILTDAQKSDQVRRIKDRGTGELFPPPKRDLMKKRFEETAYMFWRLDQEDLARFCLIVARSLPGEDTVLLKNAVIQFLVDRSIDFYMGATEGEAGEKDRKDDGAPGIIIP